MNDLISRNMTITAISKKLGIKDESYLLPSEKTIVDVIREMPSAQDALDNAYAHGWTDAESKYREYLPKKGEWIDYSEEGYVECPFCHSATNCDGNKEELHFCFSCGADMRGERI